jgi:hypothetical protein
MTLTEFLLARIAEDESDAQDVHDRGCSCLPPPPGFTGPFPCDCGYPARVLAECEAKRRIVERCRPRWAILYRESERLLASAFDRQAVKIEAYSDPIWPFDGAEAILKDLAPPYADHADYREEWRP